MPIIFFIFLSGCQVTPTGFPNHLYLSNKSHINTPYEPTTDKINQLIKHKKWHQAENLLNSELASPTKNSSPPIYFKFKAQIAEQRRDILTALSSWLSYCKNQHEENCPPAWRLINQTPTHILTSIAKLPSAQPIRNWLELGPLIQTGDLDGLEKWKQHHNNLPAWIKIHETNFKKKPQSIAVLLSPKGPMEEENKAIKQGLLAAYYQTKQPNNIKLNFYNIDPKNFQQSIQSSLQNKPDLIIGLTTPDEVKKALDIIPINTPVIALAPHEEKRNNLYTLNLNQEIELKQLSRALQDHHLNKTIILHYDDAKSQQLGQNFSDILSLSSRSPVTITELSKGKEPEIIRNLMGINNSENRARQIQSKLNIKNNKMKFLPTRRNDFDSIFLALSRRQARKIVPLLRYYFIDPSNIYSTSTLLNGISNHFKNTDLNEIHLLAPNWMADKINLNPYNANLFHTISKLKDTHFQQYKIHYALGIDAFNLSQHLPILEQFPHSQLTGATGHLYLLNNGHIWRELSLLRYRNGLTQQEITP